MASKNHNHFSFVNKYKTIKKDTDDYWEKTLSKLHQNEQLQSIDEFVSKIKNGEDKNLIKKEFIEKRYSTYSKHVAKLNNSTKELYDKNYHPILAKPIIAIFIKFIPALERFTNSIVRSIVIYCIVIAAFVGLVGFSVFDRASDIPTLLSACLYLTILLSNGIKYERSNILSNNRKDSFHIRTKANKFELFFCAIMLVLLLMLTFSSSMSVPTYISDAMKSSVISNIIKYSGWVYGIFSYWIKYKTALDEYITEDISITIIGKKNDEILNKDKQISKLNSTLAKVRKTSSDKEEELKLEIKRLKANANSSSGKKTSHKKGHNS